MKSHDNDSFLSFVVENISEGLCVCHNIDELPYVRFTVWNKRMFELTGYTIDEINLSGWYQTVYPDPVLRDKAIKRMDEMRQGDNLRNEEWEITRADGQKRWLNISTSIVGDSTHTTQILALMRDVSESKQTEEKLRESEKRFKELAEMLPEAVFETDMNVNLTYANKRAFSLFGYTYEDFNNGLNGLDLIDQKDRERARENLTKRFKGETTGPVEYHALKKDGSTFPILMHVSPITQQGNAKGLRGIIIDITKIKQADELLLESKLKYQSLVESISDWVWEVDEDGRYTYVSPRIRDLLGYEPEEVVHKTPFDLMPPKEAKRVRKIFTTAVVRHEPINALENTNRHKDGHSVILETSGAAFVDARGKFSGYRGIDRDITERKHTENILLEQREKLEETNIALRVILRESEITKDELEKNVLSNIKGLLLPYLTELGSRLLDEEQQFFIDILKANIDEITSSFSRNLKLEYNDLTPREIQIADLIKQGRTNKEIARLLNITASGVDFHRRNLRKKLNIKNKKKNLRACLLSYVV